MKNGKLKIQKKFFNIINVEANQSHPNEETKSVSPNEGVETEPTQFGFLFRKPAHRNTVAMREKRPLCRDIFEVVECFESGAGNNLRYFCHGCDKFNRVTTITIMLHHLEQCPLSNVSNNEDRARMRVRLDDAIKIHFAEYGRDREAAKTSRSIADESPRARLENDDDRRKFYEASVTRYLLATNESMLKVEDPHFRRLLYDISSLSLKPEELEWLQRKRAGNLMEEKASELLNKANEDVEVAAKSHGSAVILDGWTDWDYCRLLPRLSCPKLYPMREQ